MALTNQNLKRKPTENWAKNRHFLKTNKKAHINSQQVHGKMFNMICHYGNTLKYNLTLTRMTIIRKKITAIDKDIEKTGTLIYCR